MSTHNGDSAIIFPLTATAAVSAGLWFLVTGAVWQLLPIGAAVFVVFQAAKALNRR